MIRICEWYELVPFAYNSHIICWRNNRVSDYFETKPTEKTASSLKLYKPKICACKRAIYKTGGIGTNQFLISGPSNFP